jgi:hypothetical protein
MKGLSNFVVGVAKMLAGLLILAIIAIIVLMII